jgi:hypothetical protein
MELPAWREFLDPAGEPVVPVDFNPEGPAAGVAPTEVRPKYVSFGEKHPSFFEDLAKQMPAHPVPSVFAGLHRLQGAFIHPVVLHDLADVGLSVSASWEIEHGVGALVHDRRVVEVGFADVSLTQWIADQDRDDSIVEPPPNR